MSTETSLAIRRWQIGLLALGAALLVLGGIVLLDQVSPRRYVGILSWFAGAIIAHDLIIAPIVFSVGVLMRRAGRRIPVAVLAIVQGAIVVGAIMALIVFPEIYKKSVGTNNPTLVPLDYGINLAVFYAVLLVVTAIAVTIYLRVFASRQKVRTSSSQTYR